MEVDPDNSVVVICAKGIQREQAGRHDEAAGLFKQAWNESTDAFERTIAAHYVARHQENPENALHWNLVSLNNADNVGDDRVDGFYPSLYLNLGKSYEDLGGFETARHFYESAISRLKTLPESPYGDTVRDGLGRAMQRITDLIEHSRQAL